MYNIYSVFIAVCVSENLEYKLKIEFTKKYVHSCMVE